MTKFILLWGSIIHIDIFYLKMRNRHLITTLALLHIFILHRRGWFSGCPTSWFVHSQWTTIIWIVHFSWTFICGFKGTTYHAQKYSATMHDYYLVTLSEPLIFLGFSMVSGILTMGVIWREEKNMSKHLFFRDT